MTEETTGDFWQNHSLEYLEMALKHDHQKRVPDPQGYGIRTGECGDTVEFFIVSDHEGIRSITYDIDGCVNTNACANTVVHLADKKDPEEMWQITPEDVVAFLKTLPGHETHCAELAVGAFYLALTDYQKKVPSRQAG